MWCITTTSFVVLINGSASHFFNVERGLRQGCRLSPLLFLLVAKGLSRALEVEKINTDFGGIFISPTLQITHLLFANDVLILCNGLRGDEEEIRKMLDIFGKATEMMINEKKSSLSIQNLEKEEIDLYRSLFPFEVKEFNVGLKYLGFYL